MFENEVHLPHRGAVLAALACQSSFEDAADGMGGRAWVRGALDLRADGGDPCDYRVGFWKVGGGVVHDLADAVDGRGGGGVEVEED